MITAMSSFSPRSFAPIARFSKSMNSAMRSSSLAMSSPTLASRWGLEWHLLHVGRNLDGSHGDPSGGEIENGIAREVPSPPAQQAMPVLVPLECPGHGRRQ